MGQKVVAYSDAISTMLNLLSSFTDDNMIPKPITAHDDFIIILSQYIAFLKTYTIRYNKGDFFTFLENDNPLYFYCSLKREKIIFWPLPLIPPKDYCIHSFWSQNTEKRNNTISQMRLRSVFKMRTSILNTATTEQMGYGIISFFVCFSS